MPPGTVSGIDVSRPSVARIYDVLADRHDNFAADRAEAERLLEACPGLPELVRENRAFLDRAVTWAAGQGVAQFIDLGTGLPLHPALHESARDVIPDARVAYADNDPLVLAHGRALLTAPRVPVIGADLAVRPRGRDGGVRGGRDQPGRTGVLILGLVLHFLPARRARGLVAWYAGMLAPSSVVVIAVGGSDDPVLAGKIIAAYTPAELHNHSRGQVAGFFGGLELVEPGLTEARAWRARWVFTGYSGGRRTSSPASAGSDEAQIVPAARARG